MGGFKSQTGPRICYLLLLLVWKNIYKPKMLMDQSVKIWHSLRRLNIFFLRSHPCLWLEELSADCVHLPIGVCLDPGLISNPLEVFPVFVWSLKQIFWKYKLYQKPQDRKPSKMFQHMAGWRWRDTKREFQKPVNNNSMLCVQHWNPPVMLNAKAINNVVQP